MRRVLLRTTLALVALIGLALLVGIAGVLAVSSGWRRAELRAWCEARLTEAVGSPVTIAALEGPLYPHLTLRALRVGPSDAPFATVDSLRARVALELGPHGPRLVIESLALDAPVLSLREPSPGEPWLPGVRSTAAPEEPTSKSLPLDVVLRRLRVSGGRYEVRLAAEPGAWRGVAGRFELEAHSIELVGPKASGLPARSRLRLEVERANLGGRALGTGWLVATSTGKEWRVIEGRIEGPALRAELEGHGDVSGVEELSLRAGTQDLKTLAVWLPAAKELAGSAHVAAILSGPWRELGGRVEIDASDLATGKIPLGRLQARARFSPDGRIAVPSFSLAGSRLSLRARDPIELVVDTAGVTVHSLRLFAGADAEEPWLEVAGRVAGGRAEALRVRGSAIDVAVLAALAGHVEPKLGGTLEGDFRVDGPLGDPQLEGAVTWTRARFGESRAERLRLTVETRGELVRGALQAELDASEAVSVDFALPARTLLTPREMLVASQTRIRVRSERLELTRVAPFVRDSLERVEGRVRFDLVLEGAQPLPAISGTAAVREASAKLAATGWRAEELDAALRFAPGAFEIDGLSGSIGERRVRLELAARVEDVSRGRIVLERFVVALDDSAPVALAAPAPLTFAGNEVATDAFRLESPLGTLAVTGRFSPRSVSGGRLRLDALDLTGISRLAGIHPSLGGTLFAELAIEGALPLPRLGGSIRWEAPRYADVETPAERLRIDLAPQPDRLALEAQLDVEGRAALHAQAVLPWARVPEAPSAWLRDPSMTAQVTAEALDLAWLAPFARGFARSPRGRVDAELEVTGTAGGPELDGRLALAEASLELPALGLRLEPIEGSARFDARAIRVERLHLGEAEAGATLSGEIALPPERPAAAALELQLNGFHVIGRRTIDARLHGRVSLNGPLDAAKIEGEVELRDARLHLPEPRDPVLREVRVLGGPDRVPVREQPDAPGAWEKAALDLTLLVPRNTWVTGRGATAEITGEVRLRKDRDEPLRWFGSLQTVRGAYELHGRRFEILQGVAAFTGSPEPDPQLHGVARYRVRDVAVLLTVSGFLSEPQLELSSNPTMPEDDVLAYLLFGRPAREVGQAGSGLEAAAAQLAGRMAAERVRGLLGDVLPVETIDVEVGAEGARVGVGAYATEDVFVEVGRSFGTEPTEELRVEWRFSPNWSLIGEASTDETAGADLIWSTDF